MFKGLINSCFFNPLLKLVIDKMLNITFNENNIKNIFKNILINSSLFVKDNENKVPPKKVN